MTHHHWLAFGAAILIVVGLLMIGVAVQQWLEWRRGRDSALLVDLPSVSSR